MPAVVTVIRPVEPSIRAHCESEAPLISILIATANRRRKDNPVAPTYASRSILKILVSCSTARSLSSSGIGLPMVGSRNAQCPEGLDRQHEPQRTLLHLTQQIERLTDPAPIDTGTTRSNAAMPPLRPISPPYASSGRLPKKGGKPSS